MEISLPYLKENYNFIFETLGHYYNMSCNWPFCYQNKQTEQKQKQKKNNSNKTKKHHGILIVHIVPTDNKNNNFGL